MAKATKQDDGSKLEKLKAEMEKKYGKGTIMSAGQKQETESVTTGSVVFDKATDCGGIPIGKLVEVFGPESSGKSTITLHIISEFQKKGKKCLLMDFEYSFDKRYAKEIGVNVDELIFSQPETMEDGWNIIHDYVKSGEIGLVILDSHTSMVPKAVLEGEVGEVKMAPEARLNSIALKKLKPDLEKFGCTLVGISQLRSPIGQMGAVGDKPTGGNGWKFYSDLRLKVYKMLDRQNEANKTFVEIIKNRCGVPFGKAGIIIGWGIGFDKIQEVIDLGIKFKHLVKSGSWYSLADGTKVGQGTSAVKQFFEDNPEVFEDIRAKSVAAYIAEDLEIVKPEEGKEEELPENAIIE